MAMAAVNEQESVIDVAGTVGPRIVIEAELEWRRRDRGRHEKRNRRSKGCRVQVFQSFVHLAKPLVR
jgi:hypothetical protein